MKLVAFKYKKWGLLCIVIGVVFSIINLCTDFRIESPVLAIYSGYIEQRFFAISHTNITDEVAMFFLLTGLTVISLTEERIENEITKKIRYNALLLSIVVNYIYLAGSVLTIFGSGFVFIVVSCMFSQVTFYLICFYVLKYKEKQLG